MIELIGAESLAQMCQAQRAVVVVAPGWSGFAQEVERQIERLEGELARGTPEARVEFFSLRVDEPARNPVPWAWVEAADGEPLPLLPMIAVGAGSVLVVRRGAVQSFQSTGYALGADALRQWVLRELSEHEAGSTGP